MGGNWRKVVSGRFFLLIAFSVAKIEFSLIRKRVFSSIIFPERLRLVHISVSNVFESWFFCKSSVSTSKKQAIQLVCNYYVKLPLTILTNNVQVQYSLGMFFVFQLFFRTLLNFGCLKLLFIFLNNNPTHFQNDCSYEHLKRKFICFLAHKFLSGWALNRHSYWRFCLLMTDFFRVKL